MVGVIFPEEGYEIIPTGFLCGFIVLSDIVRFAKKRELYHLDLVSLSWTIQERHLLATWRRGFVWRKGLTSID